MLNSIMVVERKKAMVSIGPQEKTNTNNEIPEDICDRVMAAKDQKHPHVAVAEL